MATFGRLAADLGRSGPTFGQLRRKLGQLCPMCANFDQNLAKSRLPAQVFDNLSATFGRLRSTPGVIFRDAGRATFPQRSRIMFVLHQALLARGSSRLREPARPAGVGGADRSRRVEQEARAPRAALLAVTSSGAPRSIGPSAPSPCRVRELASGESRRRLCVAYGDAAPWPRSAWVRSAGLAAARDAHPLAA